MADGRNRQVLMGNDTLCMTGIADFSRHWEKKRSLLIPLSPVEEGHLHCTCDSPPHDSSPL